MYPQWEHDYASGCLYDANEVSSLSPSHLGLRSPTLRQLKESRKWIASGLELLQGDIEHRGFNVPSIPPLHLQPEVRQGLGSSPEVRDQTYDSSQMSECANISAAYVPFTEAWTERRKRDREVVEAALTVLNSSLPGVGSWTSDFPDGIDENCEPETHHATERPAMPPTLSAAGPKKHAHRQKILDRIKKHQHRGTVKLATLSHSSSWRTLLQTPCLSEWLSFFLSNLDEWVEHANDEEWDWLTNIANLIDRLSKRFRRYRYQLLIYALLFLLFSEFASNSRPFCTTMPWNIRPSLLVLWGVCWMFYPDTPGQNGSGSNAHWPREFDVEGAEPVALTGQPEISDFMPFADLDYSDYPFEPSYENGLLSAQAGNTRSDMLGQSGFEGVTSSPTLAFQGIEPSVYTQDGASNNTGAKEQPIAGPSAATQFALRPQPDTCTKDTRHICPVCSKVYTRAYSLGRHQLEKGHTVEVHAGSTRNDSSTNIPREFLCPYSPCRKAQVGNGFPRNYLLQRHVASMCKFRPREDGQLQEPSPPNQNLSETQLLPSHTSNNLNGDGKSDTISGDGGRTNSDTEGAALSCADPLVTLTKEQLAQGTGIKRSLEEFLDQLQEQLHAKEQQLRNTQNDCKRLRKKISNLGNTIINLK